VVDRGQDILVQSRSVAQKSLGFLFYPGGLVKPEAYLPALVPLAESGYPVVVVKMPFDLAFFDTEKGVGLTGSVPGVGRWAIGGHSLGGVAAAMAVEKHPGKFAGLVLWASYPGSGNSLARATIPTISIRASEDGLATPAKVGAAASLLPPDTERVVIEGGNHGQFGDYGPQKGDGTATLSRLAQQEQVANATRAFFERL
jgi:pimeloyl-ACP methyl ester carboxylesterase